jgi:hypothetical protein
VSRDVRLQRRCPRPIGDFFAMSLDTVVLTFKPPFAWRVPAADLVLA